MRLFCCDSYEELHNLKQTDNCNYLVATSNYEFYKAMKNLKENIVFLESHEIFPYEIVWDFLDKIHNIIDAVCRDECAHLFHFRYSFEGDYSSKISQMIINLNLIHDIVRNYNITVIYLYDNKDNWIINESIALYAKSRKLELHILDHTCSELVCLTTFKFIDTAMEKYSESDTVSEEEKKNHCFISKALRQAKCRIVEEDEIGVLYCCKTAYNKHVEWTLRRIGAIGGRVRVICYYDTEDVGKFRDKKILADCMEDFFVREDFVEEWKRVKKEREKVLYAVEQQLKAVYLEVDLSLWIVLKMRNYYYRELINRVYMNVCIKNYFSHNSFHYIGAWGNTNFWETRICYYNTRKSNTKLFSIGMTSFIKERNKQPYLNMFSAVFVPNERTFKNAYLDKYFGKICYIPDMIWGNKNNKNSIFTPECKGKTIGIFPTGIVSGYTTFYFYYHEMMLLIERLLNENFEVIFKNHPGVHGCWEIDVNKRFGDNKNFKYHDAFESINNVMESCDIVITDISSVVFDATVMRKAAFCFVDSQGYELISQHEGGYLIYTSMEDMIRNIKVIIEDKEMYREVVEKQNRYQMDYTGGHYNFDGEVIRNFLYSLN